MVGFNDSGSNLCGTDLYGVRDGQAGGTARSEDAHDPPPAAPEDDHAPAVPEDVHASPVLVDVHAPPPTAPEDDHAPPVLVDDHALPSPAPVVDVLFNDSDPDFCGTDLYGVRDGQAGGMARSEDAHAPPPAAPEDDHAPPVLVDDHAPPAAAPVKLLPEVELEVASSCPDFITFNQKLLLFPWSFLSILTCCLFCENF